MPCSFTFSAGRRAEGALLLGQGRFDLCAVGATVARVPLRIQTSLVANAPVHRHARLLRHVEAYERYGAPCCRAFADRKDIQKGRVRFRRNLGILRTHRTSAVYEQRPSLSHLSPVAATRQGVPRPNMSDSTIAKVITATRILAPTHPNNIRSRQSAIEGIATERKRLLGSARARRRSRPGKLAVTPRNVSAWEESLSSGSGGASGRYKI